MSLVVAVETPRQAEVAALLALSDSIAQVLYPGEPRRALNPETLDAPGIHLLVARREGAAVGCCAVLAGGDGTAELKRMVVMPADRRQGVGQALLQAAEALVRAQGAMRLRLEVGIRNSAGEALYRRAGFTDCAPFGAYRASPISRFLEKRL
ncbi:GNAT family N-acetyltransferase [Roseococcus sp. SDR]|uniref:GNAT family N-acetyltransferase n=1 Tax=Roseococcus sp. SDR TaxID=2835532 RepID=UPI001BCB5538|nr:GNAT family N-acetyltransferase [Roseococcus sp. SDR]MBS7791036.1 GNAT family N-acetyltransferase [Roseococcus sp. SDR]MBV1846350.1 GNAT family N-acetyltransferase [Roseococcus sp. SDR]